MGPVRSEDGSTLIKDVEGISQRWDEHYASLLNGGISPDYFILGDIVQKPIKHVLSDLPTMEELNECICSLKNRKAGGGDGLPSELFKYGGDGIIRRLHEFICSVWATEEIPQLCKDSTIISIYKNKGDMSIYGNSRVISLLAVAGKLLAKILLKRLITHVSEEQMPETQCGFRHNRSTSDMIFVVRLIMEKSREQHRELLMCFVDLSKAFDTFDRSMLWEIPAKSGCPEKFISLIRQFHDGMEARVKVGNSMSEPFGVSRGVNLLLHAFFFSSVFEI